jgi:cell division protein FtsX
MALIVAMYASLATAVDLVVSAVVARLSFPPGSTGLLAVFLGVFAVGVAGACWGGARVLDEVEHCWDALEQQR